MALVETSPPAAHGATTRPPSSPVTAGGWSQTLAWSGVVGLAASSLWLGVVGAQTLLGADDLAQALGTARGTSVGPALLVVVAALTVAEWRWPAVRRPLLARAHLVDAGYLVLFVVAVIPLLTLVETGFAVEIGRHAHPLLLAPVPLVPRLVVVAVVLVGMDAMNWAAHVANHRSTALWRLHALHHSQEEMSVFTTFRTHPLVHATYLGTLLPALVLAASGPVPAAAVVAYGCLVTLPHANLPWTFGPVGRLVVSPAYHRLHHASTPVDVGGVGVGGTVNFGFVLVCWDWLAGHARFPSGGAAVATGLAGRPVPVEQDPDGPGPVRTMAAQLALPFRPRVPTGGR